MLKVIFLINLTMGSCWSLLRQQTLYVRDIHHVTYKKADIRVIATISQHYGVKITWRSHKVGSGRRMWFCQLKGSQPGLDRAYGELSNYIDELERSDHTYQYSG